MAGESKFDPSSFRSDMSPARGSTLKETSVYKHSVPTGLPNIEFEGRIISSSI
jgi:hypothetical protein